MFTVLNVTVHVENRSQSVVMNRTANSSVNVRLERQLSAFFLPSHA
jgi:hypothetical protein